MKVVSSVRQYGECIDIVDRHCLGGIHHRGTHVVLASHVMTPEEAFAIYGDRWQIETLFPKLNSHGFELELTRIRGQGKMEKMMAVLAVASAWCYSVVQKR